MDKLVSVIIPTTKDENIHQTLKAVENSSYKNIEIIVVCEGKERSAQRNIGIARAKGEYLLILDSDQVISKYVIEECVHIMSASWVVGIYIPEIIPGDDWFDRVRNFERQFYTATPVDVVRFVRAKDCPLFDETMSGPEDSDWERRIYGYKTPCTSPLYHCDGVDLKKYIQKKSYYGKSMKRYHELHPNDKVLKIWYRCFWIFIENGKWKRILRHPILFMGVIFILLIRGVIYVKQ